MADTPPRIVVITGASAGVGRAAARKFASAGADIALIARGEDRLLAAGSSGLPKDAAHDARDLRLRPDQASFV